MDKAFYKFYWDCGRMGYLEGAFVADKKEMDALIGKNIYFGEVLGKHSEIYGDIEEKDIELISDDPVLLEKLGDFSMGYNPLNYLEEEEDEDDYEEEG